MFLLDGKNWLSLLDGLRITVQVTSLAVVLGTVIGVFGGISSLAKSRTVRWFTRTYVELFRGVSALILLFWVFFSVPQLLGGVNITPMQGGVLALGTNMGAYCTELARGAIQAVPRGQTEACIAVNLSGYARMRHVILPQAIITMLPPYGNLVIEVLKASALVSLIALNDIMFRAQRLRTRNVDSSFDIYLATLLFYFAIALLITFGIRAAELYFSRGMDVGRSARRGI